MNSKLPKVRLILEQVTNIVLLELNLQNTNISDKGSEALAQLISTKPLISLNLKTFRSKITDAGLSQIASQLPFLPLQSIAIECGSTRITDVGAISLIDALSSLPDLTTLALSFTACHGVTDQSAKSIAVFIARHPVLQSINLGLNITHITHHGISKIRESEKEHHTNFIVRF
eukprot:TRINITY_DN2209_c0_g3_i1.p1 TRINITY_DN2209_c0_g3~~TRINITY_DN2209_c0_g3_i1.p1  ORF type:complete len:173 (-),score=4.97 TRINITY_DN2209_c0_g3_i1:42-560(-)